MAVFFADGTIASATVIDAQLNYNLPSLKSTLKVGASNIGGKEYGQVLELVYWSTIFCSWTINP
jgi:hypothetical protein